MSTKVTPRGAYPHTKRVAILSLFLEQAQDGKIIALQAWTS